MFSFFAGLILGTGLSTMVFIVWSMEITKKHLRDKRSLMMSWDVERRRYMGAGNE